MSASVVTQIQHITRNYRLKVLILFDEADSVFSVSCHDPGDVIVGAASNASLEQAVYVACRRAVKYMTEGTPEPGDHGALTPPSET